jgi:hypothetical protein
MFNFLKTFLEEKKKRREITWKEPFFCERFCVGLFHLAERILEQGS